MGKFLSQTSMSHLTSRQMSSTSTSTAMPAHKGGCRSSLPNIPLDIYGLIIDEYVSSCQPAEKMKSLKNLSMTNRSFRAVFYPHLFSRLCLNHEYDHKDRPFLVSAPNIAKFARKFEFIFCHTFSWSDPESHIKDKFASDLCSKLCSSRLKEINIEALSEALDWRHLSSTLASGLTRLILSANLTCLSLTEI